MKYFLFTFVLLLFVTACRQEKIKPLAAKDNIEARFLRMKAGNLK
jgi:uncharacterized membrane protein